MKNDLLRHAVLALLLLMPTITLADGDPSQTPLTTKESLLAELNTSRGTIQNKTPRNKVAPPSPENADSSKKLKDKDQALAFLLNEIEELKSKTAIMKATVLHTERPERKKRVGTRTVYPYQDGKIYEVFAGIDRITDISLDPNERLTNSPLAGDTVRWKIGIILSGSGSNETQHVILKPLEEGIETNVILTTNKRTYHLRVKSGDWYMPSVSWNYPQEELARAVPKNIETERDPCPELSLEQANFNYSIESRSDYDWRPIAVFDDGEKTFFKMPKKLRTSEAPALFLIDEDDDVQVVNYRLLCGHYVVDRLFERAEMRVAKKKVEIQSDRYNPGLFDWLF